jgi:2,3-bisphosphoglycerate-independent phosphoglycerate mutase
VKYGVVILDGAADEALADLGGQTPLQAARTPRLDALGARGRVGLVSTTPEGLEPGSDVGCLSLLGYDPRKAPPGRAALEALALGLTMEASDQAIRMNFVTLGPESGEGAGLMLDHSAGLLRDAEGQILARDVLAAWREREPELAKSLELIHGRSYRSVLVDRGRSLGEGLDCVPPHECIGEPWRENLPRGQGAERLVRLIEISREVLGRHEVNSARRGAARPEANAAWPWGPSEARPLQPFRERFGVRGAMISPVDLLCGMARGIGWEVLDVPGLTSGADTDYGAQGRAACDALARFDLVCAHVETPDEMSHQGDWRGKVASIEAIDRFVVGPLADRMTEFGDAERDGDCEGWRILVAIDHATRCETRRHDAMPVPFLMAGAWVRSLVPRRLTEADGAGADLRIDAGHELMEYFLHGGLARVRAKGRSA